VPRDGQQRRAADGLPHGALPARRAAAVAGAEAAAGRAREQTTTRAMRRAAHCERFKRAALL